MMSRSTISIRNFDGIPVLVPNAVTEGDGFYISYNNVDTGTYGSDTTALVKGDGEHFYVLNGDHRNGYAPLIPQGFDACLDYFRQHDEQMNRYSEQAPPAA